MKKLLIHSLIGIFLLTGLITSFINIVKSAPAIRMGRDVYWNTDLEPLADNLVNLGSTTKRISTGYFYNLNATGTSIFATTTFTVAPIVGTSSLSTNWKDNGTASYQINGNVGIGTTNPTLAKLQVEAGNGVVGQYINGGTTAGIDLLKLKANASTQKVTLEGIGAVTPVQTFLESGSTIGLFGTATNHDFRIRTNYLDRMSITSKGNIGVGIIAPLSNLHTYTTGILASTTLMERAGQTADTPFTALRALSTKTTNMGDGFGSLLSFNIKDDANVNNLIGSIGAVRAGADNTGDLVFRPITIGTENERMRITSAGNVGIGTTNPSRKLDISSGSVRLDSTTNLLNGIIYKDSVPFIYDFRYNTSVDGKNLFIGTSVGNFTMGSSATSSGSSSYNLGIGATLLTSITTGRANLAIGYNNLNSTANTTNNVAIGTNNLSGSNIGSENIALGSSVFSRSTFSGNYSIGIGAGVMGNAVSGDYSVGIGLSTLRNNGGNDNIAIGRNAGRYSGPGVSTALASTSNSIYIGSFANGVNNSTNEIVIGSNNVGNGTNSVTLGNSSITKTILSGNIGIGTTTPAYKLDVEGVIRARNSYVYEKGTYAGIYLNDGSTAQSIATGATYTKLDGFTTNGLYSNASSTVSLDKIVATKAGVYRFESSLSFSAGTGNTVWRCAAFVNNVEQENVHFSRKIGTAGDVGNAGMTGLVRVGANQDVDVRCRHDNGGSVDLTLQYGSLNINYLGE